MSEHVEATGLPEIRPAVSLFDLAEANLTPDPDNMNLHNKKNLDAIEASVDETGFNRSIFCDENGMIIAGNGTYEVAKKKGAKFAIIDIDDDNTLVVVRKKGLTKTEKHRAGLWDNETARLATRNREAMKRVATENPDQMIMEGIISDKDQARIMKAHEDAQSLASGGAADAPEFAVNKQLAAESSVRMVQLFFTKDNITGFMERVKSLSKLFPEVKNTTEAVEAIVSRAFDEWVTTPTTVGEVATTLLPPE